MVFTEVMQNPDAVGDSEGEWFEVFNRSGGPVDLGGCIVRDDGSNSFTISGSLTAPPGGYLLLAKNGDFGVNGGVVADYEYGSSDLGNTDDELILECGGVEIDRIEWDGGPGWPDPTGASMTLDESFLMNNNDGARWCEATSSFGMGDLGTPGDPNDPC